LRANGFDLVDGQRSDTGELLAVEQQQRSGDAVGQIDGVVVQESGDLCPAFVAAAGGVAWGAAQGGDGEGFGVVSGGGPLQEVPDVVAGRPAGQVVLDVALPEVGQGDAPVGEPGQEADRGGDVGPGVLGVAAGPFGVLGSGS